MTLNYQMKLGDCIFCVIENRGHFPDAVWKNPLNISLREKRRDLKMLLPGDIIFIPDIRPKEVGEPTNQVHKFRMKAGKHPHWIEIELIGEDNVPIPGEKYRVILPDGNSVEGELDENGWARVEGDPAGECVISFPKLDKESWEFVEVLGAREASS